MDINTIFPLSFWHIEPSKKCFLKCPRCPRTEAKGMYSIENLNIELFKKNFSKELILKAKVFLLCGGEGDPIYHDELPTLTSYLKSVNPEVSLNIITNGSYRSESWWHDLGRSLNENDSITYSIDGWDNDSNRMYRFGSDWNSIMTGINIMRQYRVLLNWSLIVFKFNINKIDEIKIHAHKMGFDRFSIVSSCLFGSQNKKYLDSKSFDSLEPDIEFVSATGRHQKKIIHFTDRSIDAERRFSGLVNKEKNDQLKGNSKQVVEPKCLNRGHGLYLSAEGFFYPCSWVSHPYEGVKRSKLNPEKVEEWEQSFFIKHRNELSLNSRTMENILQDPIWEYQKKVWEEGNVFSLTCEQKCLKK